MTAASAGYEYFEVEADVGVRAWGPSAGEAFAQAAAGVLALTVDPSNVLPSERREVRAQGESREALLVNFVNECLYVHEIEGIVVRTVEVDVCDEHLVHGVLHGEELDRSRHHLGTVVKAATLHHVQVTVDEGVWAVRIVVDV
jgi:SHS2 domain-containing protein